MKNATGESMHDSGMLTPPPQPLLATPARGADDIHLHRMILAGFAVLLVVAPAVVYPVLLMKLMCFAMFAMAFNLLIGFGGLLSFGHAAFFGGGSYACAYLAKVAGLTPELALLSSVAAMALLGAICGTIAIKRDGIYFAMITLALAQLFYFLAVLNTQITGGENGIQAVPRGLLFGILDLKSDLALYTCVAVLFIGSIALVHRIIHSPFGQVCKAIRDNEARAISVGYSVNRYKIMLFTLSAAIAGLAGATKALVFQMATLSDVHWSTSGEVILMTLLGGMGTIFGPIVGATVVVALQNFLAGFGEWVTVIQGVVFAICVLAFRDGLIGLVAKRTGRQL
jgi:branched-chain amino acid transport system permease protein